MLCDYRTMDDYLLKRIKLYNQTHKWQEYDNVSSLKKANTGPVRPAGVVLQRPKPDYSKEENDAKQLFNRHNYASKNPWFEYEGYSIFIDNVYYREYNRNDFSAIIKDKCNVLISGYFLYIKDISFVKGYLESHLNRLIKEDYIRTNKIHIIQQKNKTPRYIDKSSFAYSNRRSDIVDEEPMKVLKHKRKFFFNDPVKNHGYVGELQKKVIGTRAVGPDGRLIEISKKDDYNLNDNNNK